MGTNFYIKRNVCKHCQREEEKIHLGKSSVGWIFGLQYNYGEYYTNWSDMKKWLKKELDNNSLIFDEYGIKISLKDFISWVESTQSQPNKRESMSNVIFDNEGYSFICNEFS